MPTLRVFILAQDPLARAGLAALLSDQPEWVVVDEPESGGDVIEALDLHGPDVLVWDMGWDAETELDRFGEYRGMLPPTLVLLPSVEHAGEAWASGARSMMLRGADWPALVAALPAVAAGSVVLDPELAEAVSPPRTESPSAPAAELTARETQVLQVLAEGLPNKTIAARLGISEHTVKFHVNAIMGKLGARSRTEAVTIATRLGLVLL